jgi:hypothetical protein
MALQVTNQGSVQALVEDVAAGNTAASIVPAWFVNQNVGIPTAQQDGLTLGTAFATTEQLSQALCPSGQTLNMGRSSITVRILPGSYGALELVISPRAGTNSAFTILADFLSTPATLTSVVNTVPGVTQGRITISGANFDAARQRVRSDSTLAVTFGTGPLNAANDSFVKTWYSLATNTTVNVANGSTVTLETLQVTIQRVVIRPISEKNAALNFSLNDCILPNGATIPTNQGSSVATMVGCELGSGGRVNANVGIRACKLTATILIGIANVGAPATQGCLYQGQTIVSLTPCTIDVGNCFDAGTLLFQTSARANFNSNPEFSNGAGLTAITVNPGSNVEWSTAAVAFGFGTAYAVGWNLASGSQVVASSIAAASIPSTQNVVMTGQNVAYAGLPRTYARAACTFAINPDPAALPTTV